MVNLSHALAFALAATVPLVQGQQQTSRCVAGDVCASIRVAQGSPNTLFLQITAPSTGWSAVGLGSQMAGALIFVVYPNGRGGVTVSPRLATGHVMPRFADSIRATALNGTAVVGDRLTANIRCDGCNQWNGGSADFTSSNQGFIFAHNGQNIASTSTSQIIQQHDAYGRFTLSPAAATSEFSVQSNPFEGSNTPTPTDGTNSRPDPSPTGSLASSRRGLIAHGIVATIVFLFLLPFGVLALPDRLPLGGAVRTRVLSHGLIQTLAFALATTAVGLACWYEEVRDNHFTSTHQRMGYVPFALLALQLPLGIVHHLLFRRRGRSPLRPVHVWLGRAILLLGFVVGGFGVEQARVLGLAGTGEANQGRGLVWAWTGVAAAWVLVWGGWRALKGRRDRRGEKR